jgi:hypothetical protein
MLKQINSHLDLKQIKDTDYLLILSIGQTLKISRMVWGFEGWEFEVQFIVRHPGASSGM